MVMGLFAVTSCQEDDTVYPRTRLFQPVLNGDGLKAKDNTILVTMGNMKEAVYYSIEVSRDSFATVDYSFQTDTSAFVIGKETVGEDLLWFTIYQVRATAHADNEQYNSLPSLLGSVRTEKFPSNMGTPTYFDILDTQAKVFWTPAGAPITHVKVFAGDDARLENPLNEFELTDEEKANQLKIVTGLAPSTTYQIAIYSQDRVRGWEVYSTRVPLVEGDNVINLSGIDTVVNLAAVLADAEDGSVLLLEGGKTYLAGGYSFDKSVSFMAGYSFVPALPIIDCTSNFNLNDGSTVGYVTFKDIHLTASDNGYGGRYIFNIDQSGTIGEIKFESCRIRTLRGLCRMKEGEGLLDKYTINDCYIDSINGYALLTVDKNTWACNDILIENSTISKTIYFLQSRNNSNSVVINNCTINESPEKGRPIFRWRESGQDNVANGITITNTIWGHGWNTAGEPDYAVDGFDGLEASNWSIVNSYATGDFGIAEGKEAIPGFPSVTYSGSAADLWTEPYNAIFDFKDTGFAGKSDSGDPRWRIGL
jgi:hypothetical protein